MLAAMPTVREVQAALAKAATRERPQRPGPMPYLGWAVEKESAPLVTRDAMLGVLAEARATTRLARWTLVIILALAVSIVGIALTLLA
jgi:hypothetical protein